MSPAVIELFLACMNYLPKHKVRRSLALIDIVGLESSVTELEHNSAYQELCAITEEFHPDCKGAPLVNYHKHQEWVLYRGLLMRKIGYIGDIASTFALIVAAQLLCAVYMLSLEQSSARAHQLAVIDELIEYLRNDIAHARAAGLGVAAAAWPDIGLEDVGLERRKMELAEHYLQAAEATLRDWNTLFCEAPLFCEAQKR